MLLPFYLMSIGLSSGLVGIYARHFLALAGYVPNFEIGMLAAIGVAAAFAGIQLSIMTLIQLAGPTTSSGPLFTGSIAQWTSLIFIPYILQIQIPWPMEQLQRVEALIYLGVFAVLHGSFILITLYTALQSKPATRFLIFPWGGAALVAFWASAYILGLWRDDLNNHQRIALNEAETIQLYNYHGAAQSIPEGTTYTFPLDTIQDGLLLRWATPDTGGEALDLFHVTVNFDNTFAAPKQHELTMPEAGWAELVVPASDIPEDAEQCTVLWTENPEAPWVTLTGVRPVVASNQELLMAAPRTVSPHATDGPPNFVILLIEGLGAAHVTHLGYKRNTTPYLDQYAESTLIFEQAITPAPEVPAATQSLLTGLSPLEHGTFEGQAIPLTTTATHLPSQLQQLGYITAAFTEGKGKDAQDLTLDSPFHLGFDHLDDTYPIVQGNTPSDVEPKGAQHTLNRALAWIQQHEDQRQAVFIRIRELRDPQPLKRYGTTFLSNPRRPAAKDVYDNALSNVDVAIGQFINQLQALDNYTNTGVIITSPYGIDYSRKGQEGLYLTETTLHVPLLMKLPGQSPRKRSDLVGLEDLAPTLLRIAGANTVVGNNLLLFGERKQHIAMMNNPLALSLRTRPWRFTWMSGRDPFTMAQKSGASALALHDMTKYRLGYAYRIDLDKNPSLVTEYEKVLQNYLEARQ